MNRSRNGSSIDTLNSVDIVDLVKCGGVVLGVSEGFSCYSMQNSP